MSGRAEARAGFRTASAAMLVAILLLALVAQGQPAPVTDAGPADGQPEVAFVPNRGQLDETVRYSARGPGFAFHFTDRKVVLDLRRGDRAVALHLGFDAANPEPVIVAERRKPERVNYLVGTERHPNLPTFAQLRYRDLWPGIDMVFRGSGGMLKYEFLISPGGDPRDIRLAYAGADSLRVSAGGSLVIGTPLGPLRDAAPVATQQGRRVGVRYAASGTSYGFSVAAFDRSRSLLIDPGLGYSTYLGGETNASGDDAFDHMSAVDVDAMGNAYAVGWTEAVDFPTTPGAYDPSDNPGRDGFVTKLNPDGQMVYSTYLGGSGPEGASLSDVAVDESGHAYVTGAADKFDDFPTTPGAYRQTPSDDEEIPPATNLVAKLSPDGSDLVYSTFIGEASVDGSIDVLDGRAYVAGGVDGDYPVTPGAFDTTRTSGIGASYVTKLNATGSGLEYSTYFEGASINEIAVDGSGRTFLAGQTNGGLPTTPGAYDLTWNGNTDAFAAKLNAGGTGLLFSTYLGGGNLDRAEGIDFDVAGNAYLTGYTDPWPASDFPTTPGSYSPTRIGNGFVTKLSSSGAALIYSTFLAGSWAGLPSIDVDPGGSAWIADRIEDWQQPLETTADAHDATLDGGSDGYLLKVTPGGDALSYATYIGGSASDAAHDVKLDALGNAYVVGETYSTDFPITPGAADPVLTPSEDGFQEDGFVTKFDLAPFTGYPRPKSASPALFSLVVAYEQCTGPNEVHGPPLAYPSCAAPQKASDHLTVGTPDVNGLAPWNDGFLKFKTLVGNPATPADEADVQLDLHLDDVYTNALADYAGELRAQYTVRLTDRDSTAPPGGPPGATVSDFPLGMTVPCTPVTDAPRGATCSAATTMDALVPGSVKEGMRAVWALDRVRVFDGGADGDGDTAGDNTLFATQGVFIP